MKKISTSVSLLVFLCQTSVAQWQELTIPTTQDIKSSSFISDDEGWIGTVNSGSPVTIFHTIDGGATWEADSITGAAGGTTYLEFVNALEGFAIVNGGAFKTTDGGSTWNQFTLPDAAYYEPYFLNEDTGFISGYDNIYKTTDAGLSWEVHETEGGRFYSIDFLNDSVGAGCEYDGWLSGTIDGGITWESLDLLLGFEYFFAVSYKSDGDYYYTGYHDITGEYFIKYPGGYIYDTDYPGDFDELYDINWFDNIRCYAVGQDGFVVSTVNEGNDWEGIQVPELFGLPNINLYQVDGGDDVFVFGEDGHAFKLPYSCATTSLFSSTVNYLDVQFTNQSANADTWLWHFGDGNSSTEQHPFHTYAVGGKYDVCLVTTSDSCGSDSLCLSVIVCEPNVSFALGGSLDSGFASDGILIDDSAGLYDGVYNLQILPDGKILACDGGLWVNIAKYDSDGSRDSTFGTNGIVSESYIGNSESYQNRLAVAPSGRFKVCRRYQGDIRITAYNEDGSIDSSFSDDGLLIIDLSQSGESNEFASSEYQSDEKLLVLGYEPWDGINLAKFNLDGSLDLSFADDGIFNIHGLTAASDGFSGDIEVYADGRIAIALSNRYASVPFTLLRLMPNGTIDSSFGFDGVLYGTFSSDSMGGHGINTLLLQPDGKCMVIGTTYNTYDNYQYEYYYAFARFNEDGSPDSSFGNFGKDTIQLDLLDSYGTDAVLLPDGKILITGYYGFHDYEPYLTYHHKIGLMRLNADGSLDSSFGNYGVASLSENCGNTESYSIALASDRIYVGGESPDKNFLIARFHTGCNLPPAMFSFAADNLSVQFTDQTSSATSWSWDFGDGNASTEQNPSHTYTEEGTYNVCLTITDSCGSNTACQSITVCEPLNTEYIYQINNLSVHFSNLVNTADSFYWDFGDGITSDATAPDHVYASSGTYSACLYEFDVCGYADTMCYSIEVCAVVNADFTFSQTGNQVSFAIASSNATEFSWDFGDGNFSSEENPAHTYSQSGSFNACLIAGDVCSADTFCAEITTPTSCEAYFEIAADQDEEGLYYGYNLSSGENLSYYWTWGDGNSSSGQLPEHEYEDSGLYSICLYILDTVNLCADSFCADYTILKMLDGIHQIIFVDYPVNNPASSGDEFYWKVFPNPASSSATISFSMNKNSHLLIQLFSLDGKKVATIANEQLKEGNHQISLNMESLSAGIYYLKIQLDNLPYHCKLIKQ